MAEKPPLFTVTDRRKFTTEGDLREGRPAEPPPTTPGPPEAAASTDASNESFATAETSSPGGGPGLHLVGRGGGIEDAADGTDPNIAQHGGISGDAGGAGLDGDFDPGLHEGSATDPIGPGPTAIETAQQHAEYLESSALIDAMVQQADPGAPPSIEMDFQQLVQSIYLSAVVAMGAGAEPGQKPRIDIIGARQSIDMLAVLNDKTAGNLTVEEQRLLQGALFNLRMMFLEITNALATSAQRPPAGGPQKGGPRR